MQRAEHTKPHYERAFFRLIYTPEIFAFTSRLFRFLNRGIYVAVARAVAWSYAVTQHGVRRIVRRNLALLSREPVTSASAIRVFTNFGATIADYVAVGNMEPREAERLCGDRAGIEHFEEARDAGRGAVLVTGHFGFFEFGALLLGRMGFPVTVLTLSEHSAELTRWRADFRRRWGAETIEIGTDAFSSLHVVRALDEGRFAAVLADRPAGDYSTLLSLANGRIRFSLSPALLAHMADCPVIPVSISRRRDGKYRMIAKQCVWPRRLDADRKQSIEMATQKVGSLLFEEIEKTPEQWYQFVPVGI